MQVSYYFYSCKWKLLQTIKVKSDIDMAFPNKNFKIFGYLSTGVVFYTILLLINPWDFELTRTVLLEILTDLSITLLGVVLIMELGFAITKKLDVYLPWKSSLTKRILVQLGVQIILVGTFLLILKLLIPDMFTDMTYFRQSFITGIILSVLFSTIFAASSFYIQWNKANFEIVKYEKRAAKAELEFLKMQINPHFLFNNFSTLASLIEENPQLAVEYVQRLSTIYRHILKEDEQNIVPLRDELGFIKSYLFLYKTRYQDSLQVTIDIPDSTLNKGIATATMQLLIENAIKHNSISRLKPLKIEVFVQDDAIIIKNNINPLIKPVESSGIGLKNISERYMLLNKKDITITHTGDMFLVKIPLLER